ncbi:MAG: hypothetical protein Q9223_003376 [Gallowayella weberi]
MVLETSSMSDSYDASLDTPDPYDPNSQAITDNYRYDASQFPHPLPFFGPLFGYNDAYTAKLNKERIKKYTEDVRRPLSQPEFEAISFNTHKSVAIMSIGVPLFFNFGVYRAYKTREHYRFPFYGNMKKAGGWWDGHRIKLNGQTVMKGNNARFLLHGLRSSAYIFGATYAGGLFMASYATSVAVVGLLRDPRMKDLLSMTRGKIARKTGDPQAMKGQSNDPTGQGDTSLSDLYKLPRNNMGNLDDASPTAGADGYGGDVDRLGGQNMGIMSDSQMRTQETRQQASPKDSPTENRATTFRLDKVEKQPRSFSDVFDDDDASPTAAGSANEGQGDNAWERIRRQAQTRPSGGKQPKGQSWDAIQKEQKNSSTAGETFAFSSSDEQRQLAKDEAQNEFDARVERERQGGSFNENRGKRW